MNDNGPKPELKLKRILGIDYGQKITGLATYKVGDDPYPTPFGRLIYESDAKLAKDIIQLIEDEFVDMVVIGVPFFTDGKESTMTKTIKAFIEYLKTQTTCPVYWVDETLTTFEAEDRMKNDPRYNFKVDLRKIDELCAAIIIEIFMKSSL